jgi:DNA-binding CsgD family transcriptional regulator
MTESLTPAEARVLLVMARAKSERDAARQLGLNRHTVHMHLRNARSKLGVKTTRQAVASVLALHE